MKTSTSSANRISPWAVVFWLLVWQIAAMVMNQPLLLVSPLDTLRRLAALVLEPVFWRSVGFSVGRIMLGFGLSCLLGSKNNSLLLFKGKSLVSQQSLLFFQLRQSAGKLVFFIEKRQLLCFQSSLLFVQCLLEEFGTLPEHHPVQFGKVCGIISDRVFDKENALDTDSEDVIVRILKVLEKLDDGHDKVCISMPAEHVVYS